MRPEKVAVLAELVDDAARRNGKVLGVYAPDFAALVELMLANPKLIRATLIHARGLATAWSPEEVQA